MLTRQMLENLYREACEIELQAFKPGNVSIYADGHDMTVRDFQMSAEVSSAPLCNPEYSLGEKIFHAVQATRAAVGCNTNLGIILLCAPLIESAYLTNPAHSFRQALNEVLTNTTITDADWVFKAITLASPGGLGDADAQDVHQAASVNLVDAMKLAGERDRIAMQYANGYKDIFDFAVLRYNSWLSRWRDPSWAAVFLYAELLSRFPDSHIERKFGKKYTELVATRMRQFLEEFGQSADLIAIKHKLYSLDTEYKTIGVNPGTTADMTVATIMTVLIEEQTTLK